MVLLAQVSQYNLSAKRFRAKNHAPGLGGGLAAFGFRGRRGLLGAAGPVRPDAGLRALAVPARGAGRFWRAIFELGMRQD